MGYAAPPMAGIATAPLAKALAGAKKTRLAARTWGTTYKLPGLLDESAGGAFDECDQVIDFFAAGFLRLQFFERLRGVQFGGE